MLNTGIWGYYFLKILAHDDIRYDETYAAFTYGLEDNSKEQKKNHLKQLRKKSLVIDCVLAVLATALSFIYLYYAVMLSRDSTGSPH